MAQDSADSVTGWIESLRSGDRDTAQKLWNRYFDALVRLARGRLRGAPRAVADEEDAALSAFDSFARGAASGLYPGLDDRSDLWRLLVVITERKVIDQVQRERRLKRGGGQVAGILGPQSEASRRGSLLYVTGAEPTPEFAALVADEYRRLLGTLRDDTLRSVARLRMEGRSNTEIAHVLKCSLRTVARKLELIRGTWLCQENMGT